MRTSSWRNRTRPPTVATSSPLTCGRPWRSCWRRARDIYVAAWIRNPGSPLSIHRSRQATAGALSSRSTSFQRHSRTLSGRQRSMTRDCVWSHASRACTRSARRSAADHPASLPLWLRLVRAVRARHESRGWGVDADRTSRLMRRKMSNDHTPASSATDRNPFPEQCPKCGRRGTPLSVTVNEGSRTIGYRCQKCDHQWAEIVPEVQSF